MSLGEFGCAPLLTPRAIEALDGRVAPGQKAELRRLGQQVIQAIFAPFSRQPVKSLKSAFEAGVAEFLPLRLAVNFRLLEIVGKDALADWCSQLPDLLSEEVLRGCDALEINPRRLMRLLRISADDSRRLLSEPGKLAALAPGLPRLRHLDGLILDRTSVDFGLTALLLAFDEDIHLTAFKANFLLKESSAAVERCRKHVTALVGEELTPEERWLDGLRASHLWMGWRLKRVEVPAGPALPIVIDGTPLSESLLEDRR